MSSSSVTISQPASLEVARPEKSRGSSFLPITATIVRFDNRIGSDLAAKPEPAHGIGRFAWCVLILRPPCATWGTETGDICLVGEIDLDFVPPSENWRLPGSRLGSCVGKEGHDKALDCLWRDCRGIDIGPGELHQPLRPRAARGRWGTARRRCRSRDRRCRRRWTWRSARCRHRRSDRRPRRGRHDTAAPAARRLLRTARWLRATGPELRLPAPRLRATGTGLWLPALRLCTAGAGLRVPVWAAPVLLSRDGQLSGCGALISSARRRTKAC
jgi:hypothetical protein